MRKPTELAAADRSEALLVHAAPTLGPAQWVRAWATGSPGGLPPAANHQLIQTVGDTALRSFTAVTVMSIVTFLTMTFGTLPRTTKALWWSIAYGSVFVMLSLAIPLMYRWKRQGRLSRRRFYLVAGPIVFWAGNVWGALPLAVGDADVGQFYLAVSSSYGAALVGAFWTVGYWPLSLMYGAVVLAGAARSFSVLGRAEAGNAAAMACVLVFAMVAITFAASVVLTRTLLSEITARDRQTMVELLLNDFEGGDPDWVWETDAAFKLRYVPSRMQLAAGRNPRVEVGTRLTDVVAADPAALEAIKAREPFQSVIRTEGADGVGEIQLWGRPNILNGRCFGYQGVGKDLQAARRVVEAERTADRLDAMVTITGGITHDFNNQLATVVSSVELAQLPAPDGSVLPEQTREHLERAVEACMRSRSMTADLAVALGLQAPTSPSSFDVDHELAQVLADVAPLYPEQNIVTVVEPGVAGFADASHFRRALRNLIENACQANRRTEASGRVVVHAGAVEDPDLGAVLSIRVCDDGPGIDEALGQRIFEPFFTTRHRGGGTGLGLAVALGFARQANGSLSILPGCDCAQLDGAAFDLRIPLGTLRRSDNFHASSHDDLASRRRLSGKFLVVEDDPALASTLANWVSALGGEVDMAFTAGEALRKVGSLDADYRCVISDLLLPDGDGFEVVAALRDRHPDAPAVYMSGFSRTLPSDVAADLQCPLVAKPYSSTEMLDALASVGVVSERPGELTSQRCLSEVVRRRDPVT